MSTPQDISIKEFNYSLPDERIAKYPLEQRDQSNLLEINKGTITDYSFTNLPGLLPENGLIVFNNTKVIRARLGFHKSTGARIEIFCLEPHTPAEYTQSFASAEPVVWHCLIGNLKKWKEGSLELPLTIDGEEVMLSAFREGETESSKLVRFSWDKTQFTFSEIIEAAGKIPIPPYLNRESEEDDTVRYQTIYSKHKGSVAAPTAGLHFTDRVMQHLAERNIATHEVTLHVGAGTFKPVQADNLGGHEMHTEQFVLNAELLEPLLANMGSITAVGTTSVRTLESLYWLGVKALEKQLDKSFIELKQWEAYSLPQHYTAQEALEGLKNWLTTEQISFAYAHTGIMIAPGYQFRIIERLVTNFHQPQSTLLLLVSALIGDNWKTVYQHALDNNYRFLSYGDSCLMHKH